MPWGPPVVAYGDRLGYMWCAECVGDRSVESAYYGDGSFGEEHRCDACGKIPKHVKGADYIHFDDVGWRNHWSGS